MQRARAEFDGDLPRVNVAKEFETETHRFEVPCSLCGTRYYFDACGRLDLEIAVSGSGENLFVCTECEADYEAIEHGH